MGEETDNPYAEISIRWLPQKDRPDVFSLKKPEGSKKSEAYFNSILVELVGTEKR